MAANPDFRDLFSELSAAGAEFLVVGAHAVMYYAAPRYTKDLDLWVRPSRPNAERVLAALGAFGAPLADLTVEDLAVPGTIFQIGMEPNRVDFLTHLEAVDFAEAWGRKVTTTYDGVPIHVLSLDDLLANKRAVDRPQDRADVERLEQARRTGR